MTVQSEGDRFNEATKPESLPTMPESTIANPISTNAFEAAVITAEIPVTAAALSQTARPNPPARHAVAAEPQILPAPVLVRLVVWILLFLFIIAIIGLAVEHFHPSWLSFARNVSSSLGQIRAGSIQRPF